jgi:hypothetical protein
MNVSLAFVSSCAAPLGTKFLVCSIPPRQASAGPLPGVRLT